MRGHIRKRGKSWSVVIELDREPDGKRRQKWHTVHGTKKDAERELTRLLNEVNTGAYVEPQNLTLGEYLEQWLEHSRTRVADRTYEFYSDEVRKHIAPALGHIPLAKLQPLEIQSYYRQALENGRRDGNGGLSARTVGHHHRVLFAALRTAVKWRLLPQNPCDAVEPPRVERKEMQALTTSATLELLQTAAGTWLYLPILLAVSMGLRRGEILGLRWRDVDLQVGTLTVQQCLGKGGIVRTPKTDSSRRTISIPPGVVEALRHQLERQAEHRRELDPAYHEGDYVIAWEDGRPCLPDSLTHAFIKKARRAGLARLRFHDLRHTSATLLLTAGVDMKTVSGRLGHSSATTTLNIYAHWLREVDQHAARKMDQILGRPSGPEAE